MLLETPSATLLVIVIQNDLKWNEEAERVTTKLAERVTTKIAQCLGFLYRNISFFPKYWRKLLYYSLFQSHLIYELLV